MIFDKRKAQCDSCKNKDICKYSVDFYKNKGGLPKGYVKSDNSCTRRLE